MNKYPLIEAVDGNQFDRFVIIGDVHGCLDELYELLGKTPFVFTDPRTLTVFLGDLVDRGPKSFETVALVKDICDRYKNIKCIMGNHEEWYVRYCKHETGKAMGKINPIKGNEEKSTLAMHFANWGFDKWFDSLPTAIVWAKTIQEGSRTTLATHAGLLDGPRTNQTTRGMIRNRFVRVGRTGWSSPASLDDYRKSPKSYTPWYEHWFGPEHVVFGHMVHENVVARQHVTGLDTGCAFGGNLTALVESYPGAGIINRVRNFVTVKAKKAYSSYEQDDSNPAKPTILSKGEV